MSTGVRADAETQASPALAAAVEAATRPPGGVRLTDDAGVTAATHACAGRSSSTAG